MVIEKTSIEYKVLIEIHSLFRENINPSISNIAKGLGKSKSLNSVLNATNKLQERGLISKNEDNKIDGITDRGLSILEENNGLSLKNKLKTFLIPIVGSIACGSPTYAFEDIKGQISISEEIIKGNSEDYFILESDGDSMNEEGINKGDLLLIKKQSYANNGQIVSALIDNETATLKEFRRNDRGFFQLIPRSTNKEHKPIIVTNLIIQGILIENLGRF
ncbi:MAG: S24 family peptidase [Candidatus Gracilibacteria bacterium]|nr:S24 family peptidase [Candidatus Gracilibacteria bacterium]